MNSPTASAGGPLHRLALALLVALAVGAAGLSARPHTAEAISTTVVISQVYGGGGNSGATLRSDFIELYNRSNAPVSLSGWSVQYAAATSASWQVTTLSGSIAAGGYYLVKQADGAGGTVDLPTPDATGTVTMSSTSGKVALVSSETALSEACPLASTVDFVGYGGATCFEGAAAVGGLDSSLAALRADNGATDTDNNSADFSAGPPAPRNGASPTATPIGNATATASATPIGGPSATPTSSAACAAADTPIGAVQGSGDTTPLSGQTVTVQGVVVGDYEGSSPNLRGFYLQDAGDGDPATSDGIFVFESDNANRVTRGIVVQVTGVAGENQGQTQINATTFIILCGSSGAVEPADVSLPFPSAAYPERFEGMLVRLPQTLSVTEHFQLGRFNQVTLSSGGRLRQPTNLAEPGSPAAALQAANDLNRIIIDDASQAQNPDPIVFARGGQPLSASNTLRGGDTASGIVGVMTYTWAGNSASGNAYRVRPLGALGGALPDFQPANPRPAGAPAVGGRIQVSAANVLNYFNSFGANCSGGEGGDPTDCRGAESSAEFERQAAKVVAGLVGGGAEVIGLMEIENDGYGPDSAIQDLVSRMNAATAPGTYAFIDADAATGQTNALGTDAIKVGLIYKPGQVQPVGDTAALNTPAFVTGGDTAERNRPALAQAFEEISSGARFVVAVNHLKSKSSPCDAPDAGDGQGNCNAVRAAAASLLAAWLAGDPTGTGDPDVLIVGDLNAYAKEDPVAAIEAAGYTNLIAGRLGEDAYSYAFNGQWGYLDHALASPSMAAQVSGVAEWHVNADEPLVLDYNIEFKSAGQITGLYAPDQFRFSDHDPVIVGLDLLAEGAPSPTATSTPTATGGTPGPASPTAISTPTATGGTPGPASPTATSTPTATSGTPGPASPTATSTPTATSGTPGPASPTATSAVPATPSPTAAPGSVFLPLLSD